MRRVSAVDAAAPNAREVLKMGAIGRFASFHADILSRDAAKDKATRYPDPKMQTRKTRELGVSLGVTRYSVA
jgi:hypothetical protein